jgi:hypothetical protein
MSDESNDSSESIRIVKLTTGEEIVGMLMNNSETEYELSFPARIDVSYGKGPEGATEFIKLSNYAAFTFLFVVKIPSNAVIFISKPNDELKVMYMTYCEYLRQNPKMIISSAAEDASSDSQFTGLEMLNELFNNSDFVEFVNDLIENYEETEIVELDEEEFVEEKIEEPKAKKKKKVKPEGSKLPYNPEANPNTAEGWSDNPQDYI